MVQTGRLDICVFLWVYLSCIFLRPEFQKLWNIDIRIMSVNNQTFQQLASQFLSFKTAIYSDLHNFRTYLNNFQLSLPQYSHIPSHPSNIKQHIIQSSQSAFTKQIHNLLQHQQQLKSELLESHNRENELREANNVLRKENDQKEEKVRELVAEVQKIKDYMSELQNLNKNEEIIDFDDEGGQLENRRNDLLETIKEVSEYDFSVSMSMKSFNSELQEQFSIQQEALSTQLSQLQIRENLPSQDNFQIENYQDALEILKNYNNGLGSIMSRKERSNLCDDSAKENMASLGHNQPCPADREKRGKNGTMAKIRKMKKIEHLQLESATRQGKKPFAVIPQNQADSEDASLKESRLIIHEQSRKETNCIARNSISSTRIKSRLCQEIVSLQTQIKNLLQILAEIKAQTQSPSASSKLKDGISTISFGNGYEYRGNYDIQQKPNGFGKLLWKGQVVYQGEWRSGKLHGWGKLVLLPFQKKNSKCIVSVDGNFRNGMVEGTVVCLFNSGEKFMGAIKRGRIEEEGTFVSESGILTGHWQNNSLVFLI